MILWLKIIIVLIFFQSNFNVLGLEVSLLPSTNESSNPTVTVFPAFTVSTIVSSTTMTLPTTPGPSSIIFENITIENDCMTYEPYSRNFTYNNLSYIIRSDITWNGFDGSVRALFINHTMIPILVIPERGNAKTALFVVLHGQNFGKNIQKTEFVKLFTMPITQEGCYSQKDDRYIERHGFNGIVKYSNERNAIDYYIATSNGKYCEFEWKIGTENGILKNFTKMLTNETDLQESYGDRKLAPWSLFVCDENLIGVLSFLNGIARVHYIKPEKRPSNIYFSCSRCEGEGNNAQLHVECTGSNSTWDLTIIFPLIRKTFIYQVKNFTGDDELKIYNVVLNGTEANPGAKRCTYSENVVLNPKPFGFWPGYEPLTTTTTTTTEAPTPSPPPTTSQQPSTTTTRPRPPKRIKVRYKPREQSILLHIIFAASLATSLSCMIIVFLIASKAICYEVEVEMVKIKEQSRSCELTVTSKKEI